MCAEKKRLVTYDKRDYTIIAMPRNPRGWMRCLVVNAQHFKGQLMVHVRERVADPPPKTDEVLRNEHLQALANEIAIHCPCGARPESLDTHPHVIGCPVAKLQTLLSPKRPRTKSPVWRYGRGYGFKPIVVDDDGNTVNVLDAVIDGLILLREDIQKGLLVDEPEPADSEGAESGDDQAPAELPQSS